jgi:hypothetical protein
MSKQKAIIPRRQVYLTLIDAPRAARRLTPVEGESFHQIGCGQLKDTTWHAYGCDPCLIMDQKWIGGYFFVGVVRSEKSCDRVGRRVEFELVSYYPTPAHWHV